MTRSWLAKIISIINFEASDLRSLAEIVGGDPSSFYMWQNLSDCDLRGQDLRGMDLTGTGITSRQLDENTKIDPQFDPRFEYVGEYVTFRVSFELLALINCFAEQTHYVYRAWAIKSIFDKVLSNRRWRGDDYYHVIVNSRQLCRLIETERGRYRYLRVQVYKHQQEQMFDIVVKRGGTMSDNIYSELLLEGIISSVIPDIYKSDHRYINPQSFYERYDYHLHRIEANKR